jgi:hypothetical protein
MVFGQEPLAESGMCPVRIYSSISPRALLTAASGLLRCASPKVATRLPGSRREGPIGVVVDGRLIVGLTLVSSEGTSSPCVGQSASLCPWGCARGPVLLNWRREPPFGSFEGVWSLIVWSLPCITPSAVEEDWRNPVAERILLLQMASGISFYLRRSEKRNADG